MVTCDLIRSLQLGIATGMGLTGWYKDPYATAIDSSISSLASIPDYIHIPTYCKGMVIGQRLKNLRIIGWGNGGSWNFDQNILQLNIDNTNWSTDDTATWSEKCYSVVGDTMVISTLTKAPTEPDPPEDPGEDPGGVTGDTGEEDELPLIPID